MKKLACCLMIGWFLFAPRSARAQDQHTTVDMDEMVKVADQFYNPASFALAHRTELSLTDAQIRTLDSLSSGANHFDFMAVARPTADEKKMNEMLFNPSVPIDEDLIKRGVQARVERETTLAVDRARADRKVASVLTTLQRVAYANLRMALFANAMDHRQAAKH